MSTAVHTVPFTRRVRFELWANLCMSLREARPEPAQPRWLFSPPPYMQEPTAIPHLPPPMPREALQRVGLAPPASDTMGFPDPPRRLLRQVRQDGMRLPRRPDPPVRAQATRAMVSVQITPSARFRNGIHPEVLDTMPRITARANEDGEFDSCPSCYEDYTAADTMMMFPCLHQMHEACATAWFENHTQCPICNYNIAHGLSEAAFGEEEATREEAGPSGEH